MIYLDNAATTQMEACTGCYDAVPDYSVWQCWYTL